MHFFRQSKLRFRSTLRLSGISLCRVENKRKKKEEVIGEFRSRAVERMCSLDCLHQEITRVLNEMEGGPEFYSLQT